MKATGIVRRIDDLGRVVIPKEIRRTMRIREGDPLEIYTSNDGEVIFRKYSAISEMGESAPQVADILFKLAGVSKKEFNERRVSPELEDMMESRGQFFAEEDSSRSFIPAEGVDKQALACMPILNSGDVSGAVVFMKTDGMSTSSSLQKSLINAAAQFLGKQIEG